MHTPDAIPAPSPSLTRTEKNFLIKKNWRLICFIAKRYRGGGLSDADLQAVAAAGFLTALTTWDSARGSLAMYSSFIMQAHIRQALTVEKRQAADSLDIPLLRDGETTGDTGLDRLTARTPSPFEAASRVETRRMLHAAVRALPARLRCIILARASGETLAEIGDALGVTFEAIRQSEETALRRLRGALWFIRADRVDP